MVNYCNSYIDCSFKKMGYLMAEKKSGISNILDCNKKLDFAQEGVPVKDMRTECKKKDIKYLKFEEYGS